MDNIGLNENVLNGINNVLRKYPQVTAAAIFGSRAKGTYKPCSDVDLTVFGVVDALDVERIICDLDDLPTAFTFDVNGYELIKNPSLREHIDRTGVKIY
jgi:predicted nucleotidyltransferase